MKEDVDTLHLYLEMHDFLGERTQHRSFNNHDIIFSVEMFLIKRESILYGLDPRLTEDEVIPDNHMPIFEDLMGQVARGEGPTMDNHIIPFHVDYLKALGDQMQVLIPFLRHRPVLYDLSNQEHLISERKMTKLQKIQSIMNRHLVLDYLPNVQVADIQTFCSSNLTTNLECNILC